MNKLMELYKLAVVLIVGILCGAIGAPAYEDSCNAEYVQGDGSESRGKCVTFPECPILFDILKSRSKTTTELKLLQKLTCKPDNENPTICCALDDIRIDDINTNEYSISHKSNKTNSLATEDGITFEQNEKVKEDDKVSSSFRLLPSLKQCSATVHSDRILGGKEVSILKYPWMARIGYYSYEDEDIKFLCAGTVINKRYILSAAHCTEEINTEELKPQIIRLQERDKTCDSVYDCSTPVDLQIEEIIPHPNYSKKDKSNDIGLIRVAKDIEFNHFIQPVCLPFVEEYGLSKSIVDPSLADVLDVKKSTASVVGWGKTRWTNTEGSETLQEVYLPIMSTKACQKNYRNHTRVTITDNQLCAGGEIGKDSCSGDSGGGLFVYKNTTSDGSFSSARFFQFGVVSFGPTQCGVGGLPGVYSKVYEYRKWILDQLKP